MEGEGVSHGHLKLLHPLLLQFSRLEEQLVALSTLVLDQEKHVSPLQGSGVQNEATHTPARRKAAGQEQPPRPQGERRMDPCKGLLRRTKNTSINLNSHTHT